MANPTLHLHFYLPIASTYSVDDFVTYLRGYTEPTTAEQASEPPSDRFDTAGVSLDFKKKAVSGTADFKTSLQDADSVVVYLGHLVLDFKNKRSLGLSPMGHDAAEIKPDALMDLLKASKAKLVILATCASSTLGLEKLKKGPAVGTDFNRQFTQIGRRGWTAFVSRNWTDAPRTKIRKVRLN